ISLPNILLARKGLCGDNKKSWNLLGTNCFISLLILMGNCERKRPACRPNSNFVSTILAASDFYAASPREDPLIEARNLRSERGRKCSSFVRVSFCPGEPAGGGEKCQTAIVCPTRTSRCSTRRFTLNLPHLRLERPVLPASNLLVSVWNQLDREGDFQNFSAVSAFPLDGLVSTQQAAAASAAAAPPPPPPQRPSTHSAGNGFDLKSVLIRVPASQRPRLHCVAAQRLPRSARWTRRSPADAAGVRAGDYIVSVDSVGVFHGQQRGRGPPAARRRKGAVGARAGRGRWPAAPACRSLSRPPLPPASLRCIGGQRRRRCPRLPPPLQSTGGGGGAAASDGMRSCSRPAADGGRGSAQINEPLTLVREPICTRKIVCCSVPQAGAPCEVCLQFVGRGGRKEMLRLRCSHELESRQWCRSIQQKLLKALNMRLWLTLGLLLPPSLPATASSDFGATCSAVDSLARLAEFFARNSLKIDADGYFGAAIAFLNLRLGAHQTPAATERRVADLCGDGSGRRAASRLSISFDKLLVDFRARVGGKKSRSGGDYDVETYWGICRPMEAVMRRLLSQRRFRWRWLEDSGHHGAAVDAKQAQAWLKSLKSRLVEYNEPRGDAVLRRMWRVESGASCSASSACRRMFLSAEPNKGYALTHQLIYWAASIDRNACHLKLSMVGQWTGLCCPGACGRVLSEHRHILALNSPSSTLIDLALEQAVICGSLGYRDFFTDSTLLLLRRLQDERLGLHP
uniref:PDZ domain-containing protein n=1 Tax=Macrostomum lignano TaxID=282301 RepID=A0A1I8F9Z1_9PLAT